MSSKELADHKARNEALNIQQSYIVQAPAGSGKTGLITQRFLRLLAHASQPEDILSITFTRKAASEMRERIVNALHLAQQPEPGGEHDKQTWRLACEALQQNNNLNWQLLENPQRLRIQTIDSLCTSLVRQMPLLSRFGVQSGIEEKAEAIYRTAVESFLNATLIDRELVDMEDPVIHLLKGLNNQLSTLIDLFTSLLARRDQWIRHFVTNEKLLDKELLEHALELFVSQQLSQVHSTAPSRLGEKFFSFTQQLFTSAREQAIDISDDHPLFQIAQLKQWPIGDVEELTLWRAVSDFLLTAKGELRKRWQTSEGFIVASKVKSKELKEVAAWQKETVLDICRELSEHSLFLELLQQVRDLPDGQYSEHQWKTIESLSQCLNYLLGFLKLEFQNTGKVDFVELNLAALNALQDQSGVTDLALKLDYQIQHILVDEFQDTSHGQYELLRLLTQGWQPDDNRTMFVVGDPMQSIYRFREADVGLYLGCRRFGLADIPLRTLILSTNFRSESGIVDWVNQTFLKVFPREENAMLGAVPLSHATAFNFSDNNAVEFIHEFDGLGFSQAQHMLQRIQKIRNTSPRETIAILVRNKSHAQDIIHLLKQQHVPLEAIEMERLQERSLIKNLKNIVRMLLNPSDKLAITGLLRSEYCGLTLKSLHLILEKRDTDLWSALEFTLNNERLEAEEHQRLNDFCQRVLPYIRQSGRSPLAYQAKSCWLALGGAHLSGSERELMDATQFFLKVHETFLEESPNQVEKLDELADGLFSASVMSSENSVKIMSIHKSKGLEFDHVIIPHLERQSRAEVSQLVLWQELPLDFHPNDFLVAPMKTDDSNSDKIYQLLKSFNDEKQLLENGRLLYVGATRAKRRLYLLATSKWGKKGAQVIPRTPHKTSLLARLSPVYLPIIRQQAEDIQAKEKVEDALMPRERKFKRVGNNVQLKSWSSVLKVKDFAATLASESESIDLEWNSVNASLVGTLVHQYLEIIAEAGTEQWTVDRIHSLRPKFKQYFRQQSVSHSENIPLVERAINALISVTKDKQGQWILKKHKDARSEYSLSTHYDGQYSTSIIDRTFIDEQDIRWIIDYKVSYHSGNELEQFYANELERYQSQLKKYAQLFSLLERREIRCALYLPLHQELLVYPENFHQD